MSRWRVGARLEWRADLFPQSPTEAIFFVVPAGGKANEHVQAVAAGLVERVEDFPGITTNLGLMKGRRDRREAPAGVLLEGRARGARAAVHAAADPEGRLRRGRRQPGAPPSPEPRRLEDQYRRERSQEV